jgi:catechol 2,3-dioxygenase-like lactoylglutathione lyase family enzyme
MTFLVSDFEVARNYYGRFLGFDEAFSYQGARGKVISFKVNDRQFLEFIEDKQARDKKRMVSVSFETENVEAMRLYLESQGVRVPEKVTTDGAGNETISVLDNAGNNVEFIRFLPAAMHKQSQGRFLSERRIAKAIHHAGIYSKPITDNDTFYAGILQFKEVIRYPEDKNTPPVMIYLSMDDCAEFVEFYATDDPNISHPCFLVDNMQETVYTLKERRKDESFGKPMVGKGNRWILNLQNSDATRVEFTEAHRIR